MAESSAVKGMLMLFINWTCPVPVDCKLERNTLTALLNVRFS